MTFIKGNATFLFFAVLFFLLLSLKGGKESTDPFSKLNYDKVIAYDFNGEHEMQLVSNGKITAEVYKKTILSSSQIIYIDNVLADTITYGGQIAACFEPHFGIVYYRHDTIIGNISVCFDCNQLESSFEIPAEHYYDIIDSVDNLHLPRYGFSKQGRKKINKLVKELNFSHTIEKKNMFDE
jgi:hypothetical protein